jgi:peptidoglycan/LPS O-acetylase OafA/YrhL
MNQEGSMPRNIRALDGVRGLAIILVMLHHFEPRIPATNPMLICVKFICSYWWSGVDLFFALSGFLITGILLDTRDADNYFRAFYARRLLRIFPLYYTVLIFILVMLRPPVPLAADRKLYFLYLTNWLVLWKGHWGPNILGHFWSLAVEEQFYLIWPFCVWLLLPKKLIKVAIVVSVIALLTRIFWVAHSGPSDAIVLATVTRMDSLLCGALGAILCRDPTALPTLRKWSPRIFVVMIVAFAGCALAFLLRPDSRLYFTETLGFSLLALGFASLVVHAAVSDDSTVAVQRVFRNRVLTEFGRYSYGIYVFHVPVLMICDALIYMWLPVSLAQNVSFSIAYVGFLITTSFVIAKISYEYFERRFLALKRYFEPIYSRTEKSPIDCVAVPEV